MLMKNGTPPARAEMKELRVKIQLRNNRLVELREKRGFTQLEAAKWAGVPVSVLSSLEVMRCDHTRLACKRHPSLGRTWTKPAQILADFYDVEVWWLFPASLGSIVTNKIETKMDVDEAKALGEPSLAMRFAPDDFYTRKQLTERVEEVLGTLPPREREVLVRRLGIGCEEETLDEISEKGLTEAPTLSTGKMGQKPDKPKTVSRERVRQIEAKALRKLRHPSRSRRLTIFLDGRAMRRPPCVKQHAETDNTYSDFWNMAFPHFSCAICTKKIGLDGAIIFEVGTALVDAVNEAEGIALGKTAGPDTTYRCSHCAKDHKGLSGKRATR